MSFSANGCNLVVFANIEGLHPLEDEVVGRRALTDLKVSIFMNCLDVVVVGVLCAKQNGLSDCVSVDVFHVYVRLLYLAKVFS